jgi:hypothetical protein
MARLGFPAHGSCEHVVNLGSPPLLLRVIVDSIDAIIVYRVDRASVGRVYFEKLAPCVLEVEVLGEYYPTASIESITLALVSVYSPA